MTILLGLSCAPCGNDSVLKSQEDSAVITIVWGFDANFEVITSKDCNVHLAGITASSGP